MERYNLDGLMINSKTIDAFEEIYWFKNYKNLFLKENKINRLFDLSKEQYYDYQNLIVKYCQINNSENYLAKSNFFFFKSRKYT